MHLRDPLGHYSIQITVDVYGHLVPGANKAAVDRLDDMTSNPFGQPNRRRGIRPS